MPEPPLPGPPPLPRAPRQFSATRRAQLARGTRPFTLNAYGDPSSPFPTFPTECGALRTEFLTTDATSHHTWLLSPLSQLAESMRHYRACKERAPHTISACVVVPQWPGAHRALTAGWRLVRSIDRCTPVHDPTSAHPDGFASHPTNVYYDPPVLPNHTLASAANGDLSMLFAARHLGAKARVLVDSGASHNFMSEEWAHRTGVNTVEAHGASITLANGGTLASTRTCTLSLTMAPMKDPHLVTCYVLTLAPTFDIILGESWLAQHGAVLDFERRTCVIAINGARATLRPAAPRVFRRPTPATASMLLSSAQLRRDLRQGLRCCLVQIKSPPHATEAAAADAPDNHEDPRITALKRRFARVFQELPVDIVRPVKHRRARSR